MLTKSKIPNALTITRIVLILPILFALHSPTLAKYWIFWLFALAAATDFLDGYLARKWNVKSDLGAMFDHVSDKLLLAATLIPLTLYGVTGALTLLVIILRELYVSGLREHMALRQIAMPVSRLGQYKTAVQMIAVTVILAGITLKLPAFSVGDKNLTEPSNILLVGNILLLLGAVLGVISAIQYSVALRRKT